jgi:hypothetical protein
VVAASAGRRVATGGGIRGKLLRARATANRRGTSNLLLRRRSNPLTRINQRSRAISRGRPQIVAIPVSTNSPILRRPQPQRRQPIRYVPVMAAGNGRNTIAMYEVLHEKV